MSAETFTTADGVEVPVGGFVWEACSTLGRRRIRSVFNEGAVPWPCSKADAKHCYSTRQLARAARMEQLNKELAKLTAEKKKWYRDETKELRASAKGSEP